MIERTDISMTKKLEKFVTFQERKMCRSMFVCLRVKQTVDDMTQEAVCMR